MNKTLLHQLYSIGLLVTLTLFAYSVTGQTTVKVSSTVVADLNTSPLSLPSLRSPITQIIAPTPIPSTVNNLSSADPLGKCTIWLEYGDGGFTTQPVTTRSLRTASATPFLMAVPLYDTSKGKDGTLSRYMIGSPMAGAGGRPGAQSDNDPARLQQEENIMLTPNNYNIVPGEPLALAITYRLPVLQTATGAPPQYFAILYYNSNNLTPFQSLNSSSSSMLKYNATPSTTPTLPDIRLFTGQTLVTKLPDGLPEIPSGYSGSIVVRLDAPVNPEIERNLFVTLKALTGKAGLQIGDMTAIVTRLIKIEHGEHTILGSDTLSDMRVALAFDPNHITQLPTCLLLPKANTPLKYSIAFQNLGKGPADIVKIVFRRPAGLDGASFAIQSAKYAGKSIAVDGTDLQVVFKHGYDATSNTDTFWFTPTTNSGTSARDMWLLRGTDEVPDAKVNPLTMGEVNFTINTTTAVADNIKADADIYFHSFFASPTDNWEKAVTTNMAVSTYKQKACECDNSCPPVTSSCHIILGLCWWWWAVILLVLLLVIWLLRRRRR